MNLIEQLGEKESLAAFVVNGFGGYEKAKAVLNNPNSSFLHNTEALKQRLLEYRRENNIFEVGDKVVFKKEYGISNSSVIDIYKVNENMFQFQTIFGLTPVDTALIRHATTKEIEQGYRDE